MYLFTTEKLTNKKTRYITTCFFFVLLSLGGCSQEKPQNKKPLQEDPAFHLDESSVTKNVKSASINEIHASNNNNGTLGLQDINSNRERQDINSNGERQDFVPENDPSELREKYKGFKHHVIGIYGPDRAKQDHNNALIGRNNSVDVIVEDTSAPIILSLMSYESVVWNVSIAEGVKIAKVIIGGYESQEYMGIPAWIPVNLYTYDKSICVNACTYSRDYFHSDDDVPNKLYNLVPIKVSSIQTRYKGHRFTIKK